MAYKRTGPLSHWAACLWRFVAGGLWTNAAFESMGCDINPSCLLRAEGIGTAFHRVWECSSLEVIATRLKVAGPKLVESALAAGGQALGFSWCIVSKPPRSLLPKEQFQERWVLTGTRNCFMPSKGLVYVDGSCMDATNRLHGAVGKL